jgi:hypothetical protein
LRCDELRETQAEQVAIANAEARIPERVRKLRDHVKAQRAYRAERLRKLQAEGADPLTIRAMQEEARRYEAHALKQIATVITPALDKLGRVIDLSNFRRRVMSREEVMERVARECQERGMIAVTPRRVKAYWTEYRNFLRASQQT